MFSAEHLVMSVSLFGERKRSLVAAPYDLLVYFVVLSVKHSAILSTLFSVFFFLWRPWSMCVILYLRYSMLIARHVNERCIQTNHSHISKNGIMRDRLRDEFQLIFF